MRDFPDYWRLVLLDYPGNERGDLMTRDGEIIGTWSLDENDHFRFTPNGETVHVIFHPFLPMFVDAVLDWLKENQNSQ